MAASRRNRVARNGGLNCHYCGFQTWVHPHQKAEVERTFPAKVCPGRHRKKALQARSFTVDHVIPRAKGGGNEGGNTVPCCILCNNMKGSAPEDQFRALIAYLKKNDAHPHQLFLKTGVWFVCEHIPVQNLKAKKEPQQ